MNRPPVSLSHLRLAVPISTKPDPDRVEKSGEGYASAGACAGRRWAQSTFVGEVENLTWVSCRWASGLFATGIWNCGTKRQLDRR